MFEGEVTLVEDIHPKLEMRCLQKTISVSIQIASKYVSNKGMVVMYNVQGNHFAFK